MKRMLLSVGVGLIMTGCAGEPPASPTPVDSSCGVDCAAQRNYGLLAGTCFEYSKSPSAVTPPDLGVLVESALTDEGVTVIPVTYRVGGLRKMEDRFILKDGALYLAKRIWDAGESVGYHDSADTLAGLQWVGGSSVAGENLSSSAKAKVRSSGNLREELTTFRVAVLNPTPNELDVSAGSGASALKLSFSETPDTHGGDLRRVLEPGRGFLFLLTPLQPVGAATEYRLQTVRTLAVGVVECG